MQGLGVESEREPDGGDPQPGLPHPQAHLPLTHTRYRNKNLDF